MDRSDRAKQFLLDELSSPKTANILDVGCGYGETLVELLHREFTSLTGVDGDPKAIIHTKKSLANSGIRILEGDVEALPFAEKSFSAVLCLDVLEHVKHDQKTVDEIARVLEDEGLFIGSTPYAGWSRFVDPENILAVLQFKKPTHHHYSRVELTKLLSREFSSLYFERRGMGLSQLFFLTTYVLRPFFRAPLARIQKRISQWEYARQFGWLSYHVIFTARKSKNASL
jgi:ubiquinone/menaquinone biosynthesis C-methylase UbiE